MKGHSEKWLHTVIKDAGYESTGSVDPVKDTDFCLVLRIPTKRGDLFYKENGLSTRHEAIVSKHLDLRLQGKTARLVALNESECWFLMEDLKGKPLRNIKDKQLWQRAIQEYAELQISQMEEVESLIKMGVPDRRMPILKQEIEQYLKEMCGTGLTEDETKKVMALQPELLSMCDQIDSILPASIEHGDLHSNNIRIIDDNIVFFDWGDASVSHPFFSTRIFWHALDELIHDESEWLAMVNEFRPFYLEPWTKFATITDLDNALRISDELACVQRALSWHLYLTPHSKNKSESYDRPAQWLRLFLGHRTLVGK
ncbi:aminoglycoside phosphotransferase family protein [Fredinandcohnia sp. QZ13]|uniref:aminoglycoside phosphotransferase family protein n=1 Tax=Fredinandcohnia sp. QZ13 TaxID=3073144 RepID=UPI0028536BBB|nr:aminoglycoside phosphotransferase family protein [Fredinandcohnia sp. QZ13]MDR4888588.1 aminoglycoside phosphotransferase family protein [Fredinandcohnia sp. QZ13]